MATVDILAGDTKRVQVTFREFTESGNGTIVDPSVVTGAVWNSLKKSIGTLTPVKEGNGVYHVDWTAPMKEGYYYVGMTGTIAGEATTVRQKFKVKFVI